MPNILKSGVVVILLGLIWATESFLGKITILEGYSPFTFPLILNCGAVAFVLLCSIHPKIRKDVYKFDNTHIIILLLTSLTLVFIPYSVIYLALRIITPAETSLITSLTPLFSMIISIVIFRVGLKSSSILAGFLGLAGVGFLIIPNIHHGYELERAVWYLIMLIVPLSYAASGYFLKLTSEKNISYMQLILATNLISSIFFFFLNNEIYLSFEVTTFEITTFEFAFFGIGIILNIIAISAMLYLAGIMTPFVLSLSNYPTVLFSFVFTTLYLNETFTFSEIFAVVLIISSSYLIKVKHLE